MAKDFKKAESAVGASESAEGALVASVATKAVVVAPEMSISFDRWFTTTGKPDHWKSGMKRYAQTSGKKTLAAWTKLFENY